MITFSTLRSRFYCNVTYFKATITNSTWQIPHIFLGYSVEELCCKDGEGVYKLNQKEIEEKDADLWQHINKSYGGNFRKSPPSVQTIC